MNYEETIFCMYNDDFNEWLEYVYNPSFGLYSYRVYNSNGSVAYMGMISMDHLLAKRELEPGWEFIGAL